MSTDLALSSPQNVPADYVPPAMSGALAKAIRDMTDPHPDIGTPKALSAHVRAEAIAIGEVHRHAAGPVPEDRLRAWVMPIIAAAMVSTGKSRAVDELEIWLASLALGVGNLPVGAFTLETQRQALASIKFFPFVANIHEIVEQPAARITSLFSTLKRIILTPIESPNA